MKILFTFLFLLLTAALAPSKAVTLTAARLHSLESRSASDRQTGKAAFTTAVQKRAASLTWRERVGVFLLKRMIRREQKKNGDPAETEGLNTKLARNAQICGIVGYPALFLGGLGIILWILAIILGAKALHNIAAHPDVYGGKKSANAGILLGVFGLILTAVISFILLIYLITKIS